MRKVSILIALFASLFIANANGAIASVDSKTPVLAEKMKFGAGVGMGFNNESPLAARKPDETYRFLDVFFEVLFGNKFGIRLSVQPTRCISSNHSLSLCKVALTSRVYLGSGKQLCLFFGPQLMFLTRATIELQSGGIFDRKKEKLNLLDQSDFEALYGKHSKLRKDSAGYRFGWDYECESGLLVGAIFSSEWQINDDKKDQINFVDLFPGVSHQVIYLGYNFAKLLK